METIFGLPANTLLTVLLALSGLILLIIVAAALRFPLAFRLGLRNLPRRKSQTALIITGLALSTMIITSALGIGDTVDYSVKSGVYDSLGAIDQQIGTTRIEAAAGFGFGSGAPTTGGEGENWFSADLASAVAGLVDDQTFDAAVPALVQSLPVVNTTSELSEAAVQIRGLGQGSGAGFARLPGFDTLSDGQVLVNQTLATELEINPGDELLLIKGQPSPVTVAGIVPDGELAGGQPAVITPLAWAQDFFARPAQITAIFISNLGDAETGAALSETAVAELESLLVTEGADLVVSPVKADQLEAAATSAETITALFVTFGTFSIVSGILLIFLIFSVLAAERKSELGMSRAIGLQRADLISQFITEGLAYNLLAAAAGAALGVVAALLLASSITQLLQGSLEITPRIAPRSI
ncbi:MAG: ABC transporter permease, partial [Anaerolineales bacterium]|nr:ABC transporter permease [Anaerolineales bacterium]